MVKCNQINENVIHKIKTSKAYLNFMQEDMNKYKITNDNIANGSIYNQNFENKTLISIDMKQANFSALNYYDKHIFFEDSEDKHTWEDFMHKFTTNQHIINSK